jgi:hypothetical protein
MWGKELGQISRACDDRGVSVCSERVSTHYRQMVEYLRMLVTRSLLPACQAGLSRPSTCLPRRSLGECQVVCEGVTDVDAVSGESVVWELVSAAACPLDIR